MPLAQDTASPLPGAEAAPRPGPDNLRGSAWMMVSVVVASAMTLGVRELTATLDPRMLVLLRSVVTVVALLAMLGFSARLRRGMRFSLPWQHLLRGVLTGVSMHLGFYTIAHLPLATATILFFTAPIFATLMAGIFHGERVGPRRWTASALGFLGAVVILRPTAEGFDIAMLAALASSLLLALALSMSRKLAEADGSFATLLSSAVVTTVLSVPAAWSVLALPDSLWLWLVALGMIAAGAMRGLSDIQAYRYGEAGLLAPLTYLRLVLLGGAGYLIYSETLDAATVAGSVIIIGSTLYIARREAQLHRQRRAAG
ncbi:DMT family transporter [Oceanicella sp. SM1341]|uniref:DMT family transporter n=1 Tax=Oceanicella sp. SM1341 TaxID=1548889 RepID=UPI001300A018|nr:DMT family transporter [Oceanicella sp. SM1341]